MTVRLAILAEGFTEKAFVNKILSPHLLNYSVHATAPNLKGGVSLSALSRDIRRLVYDYDFVTTMVDYYGFGKRGQKTADEIESEILNSCGEFPGKIIPYLQRHEFEALLFSHLEKMADYFNWNSSQKGRLERIRKPPEEIDDNLPPAKLIAQIHPRYKKVLDGVEIARQIGISTIMEKCPKFAEWVQKLEGLGK